MENTQEKFNNPFPPSKHPSLSKEEKETTRANILKFMQAHPFDGVSFEQPKQRATLAGYFGSPFGRKLSYSLASLLIIFGSTSGVALAAQNSLPGDLLYPMKTQVNEKVLGWAMTSQEAKVNYEIGLVQLRLEEIEKISVQNKLDDKKSAATKVLLDSHITSAKSKISNIKKQKGKNAGIEASATLEASLNAHAKVLDTIIIEKEKESESDSKASEIKNFLRDVRARAAEAARDRENEENIKLNIQNIIK